jgi:hypothetical protein
VLLLAKIWKKDIGGKIQTYDSSVYCLKSFINKALVQSGEIFSERSWIKCSEIQEKIIKKNKKYPKNIPHKLKRYSYITLANLNVLLLE